MSNKILILDDDADILDVFKRHLERAGYEVVAVTDGKQGLRAAQAQMFDLIITDVAMPVMDGFHFFKEIRQWPAYTKVPVVVVTAHERVEDSFRIFGVTDFLSKPVRPEVILETIQRILNPHRRPIESRKIIVCGSNVEVVSNMVQLLNDHGQKAFATHDETEFLVKTLNEDPQMVLIDVLLPKLMAHELIAALRVFSRFSKLKILVYTHFSEKELTSVNAIEQLKASKNKCLEAGASAYIGRFSKVTFMESIRECDRDL